jgi:hypothetical protein
MERTHRLRYAESGVNAHVLVLSETESVLRPEGQELSKESAFTPRKCLRIVPGSFPLFMCQKEYDE